MIGAIAFCTVKGTRANVTHVRPSLLTRPSPED
jgi:hypothetical protein